MKPLHHPGSHSWGRGWVVAGDGVSSGGPAPDWGRPLLLDPLLPCCPAFSSYLPALTTQFPVLHFIILYVKLSMIKSQPASALQSSPALRGKPGAGETALGVKSGRWPTVFLTLCAAILDRADVWRMRAHLSASSTDSSSAQNPGRETGRGARKKEQASRR